jgi:hypothetical protein
MSGADQFVNAAFGSHGQQDHEFSGAVITGVNKDGTVNVNYLGADHIGIDASSGYTNRLPGDVVMIRSNGMQWIVIGKVGGELDTQPSISWGYGAPAGSGWVAATDVYVHQDGRLYVHRTGTFAGDYANTIPTPQQVIEAASDITFANNQAMDIRMPTQGMDTRPDHTPGPWAAAWVYGNDITTACAIKPVRSMEVWFERDESDHGSEDPVQLKIYLHDHTSDPSTLITSHGPTPGPFLAPGQSQWWPMPRKFVDQFESGGAKGIAIKSSLTEDFIICTESSGSVRIYN